jgi:DNA-binding winged helix-turn-helix (wHTH) protein/tetratricopeptide (TPR) repeat protein
MSGIDPLLARFGDFQLDEGNARLMRCGRPVELQPKAFAVLCELLRQPGQLVTKDSLLDRVWGHRHISESVLKTVVSQLRAVLDDDARQPRYIETASRRGYRFIAAQIPPTPTPTPTPTAAAAVPSSRAAPIGRAAPLGVLQGCLQAALQSRRQLVLVGGEAGIGKSTLIDHFVTTATPPGLAVAHGQCVEQYGAGEPYMPLLEALNGLGRGEAGAALITLMRRVAPTWLAQLPWYLEEGDASRLQREVGGTTQDRMLREFGELLDRFTAERPLLLVLEDLHWSDHATVQLLGYLARRRHPAALMLLGSFRPADVIVEGHPLAGLRHELRLHGLCREIDLESLSEAEVGELVAAKLGTDGVPEDFVRALRSHTDGLPLFVVDLLDELRADGLLRQERDGWVVEAAPRLGVPGSIAGVVEKQIARLAPLQRRMLEAASVVGAEFTHLTLAALLDVDAATVCDALDALAARPQWLCSIDATPLPDGRIAARFGFRHALYGHVFYQRQSPVQRMQWHRQVARTWLEGQAGAAPDAPSELAMHFERGDEPLAAAAQLAVVAGRALARGAAREALQAARHGLELMQPMAARADTAALELDLRVLEGVTLSRLHVISEPEVAAAFARACQLCEQVGASVSRARALHGGWWVSFARCELDLAHRLADRMLSLARDDADPGLRLAGHSTMGITLAMQGEFSEARRHLETVIELHAAIAGALAPGIFVQDPGVEARGYLGLVSWWLGDPAAARRLAAQAVDRARQLRHPISQLIALHLAAAMHHFAGEPRRCKELIEQLFDVIRVQGLPTDPGSFGWLHGHAVATLGDVEAGLAEMQAAAQSCERLGLRIGLSGYQLHLAEACRDANRPGMASAAVDAGLQIVRERGERFLLAPLLRLRGELLHGSGDIQGARAALQESLQVAREQGARFHELETLLAIAELLGENTPGEGGRQRFVGPSGA